MCTSQGFYLSSGCISTGWDCTPSGKTGIRWSSCWCVLAEHCLICFNISRTTGARCGAVINTWSKLHAQQSHNIVTSLLTCSYVVVFLAFVSRQDISSGDRGQGGAFIHLTYTLSTHPPPSQLFHLNSHRRLLFCQSYWRVRWRKDVRVRVRWGWVKGKKKVDKDWFEFCFHDKITQLISLHPTRIAISCSFPFILSRVFSSIFIMMSFLDSVFEMFYPHPCAFHSSSVQPSLPPGLASVGRFQSVCLLMTLLEADVMLSSCCFVLSPFPPYLIPSQFLSFMFACFFAVPWLFIS